MKPDPLKLEEAYRLNEIFQNRIHFVFSLGMTLILKGLSTADIGVFLFQIQNLQLQRCLLYGIERWNLF